MLACVRTSKSQAPLPVLMQLWGVIRTLSQRVDPKRAGAYPTYASQDDGTLVPVVQAYAYWKYVGHLELTFNDDGTLEIAGGDTILLDASVAPDPAILARVTELAGPIEELKATVIGASADLIEETGAYVVKMECAMGNLVADAMLAGSRIRRDGCDPKRGWSARQH